MPRLEELILPVSNLARSRDFYVDTVGLEVAVQGRDFLVLRTEEGATILLHSTGGEPITPGSFMFELRVPDLDQWFRERAEGMTGVQKPPYDVSHEGDKWSPRREARLADPDGYSIVVFSSKPRVSEPPEPDEEERRWEDEGGR